jgi:hypothetical protein
MGNPPRLLPSKYPMRVWIVLVVAVFLVDLIFWFGMFSDCGFLMVDVTESVLLIFVVCFGCFAILLLVVFCLGRWYCC